MIRYAELAVVILLRIQEDMLMFGRKCIVDKLFTFLFLLLLAGTVQAAVGRAALIQGTVTVNGQQLKTDTPINAGDVIAAGDNGSAKIIMHDRSVIDITSNSSIKISRFTYNPDSPESGGESYFDLLKGSLRYISGLIGKLNPDNVKVTAGTATIGIRGSFDTFSFDGVNVTVDTSIGQANITLADNSTLTIKAGETGNANIQTGKLSVAPTTTPDAVTQAINSIAANPDDQNGVQSALSGLNDGDLVLAIAAMIDNAATLGISETSLPTIVGTAAGVNNDLATVLVFIATAMDPDNSNAYVTSVINVVPDLTNAIEDAADSGTDLNSSLLNTSGTNGVGGAGGGGGGGGTASPATP